MTNLQRIDPSLHGFWERFLINIPFVFIVLFIAAFFAGGAFLLFYSVVVLAATGSAMAYMLFAGACALCIGAGLGFIKVFKIYYAFYERKMDIAKPASPENVTKTYDGKKPLKAYFTLSNISIAILLIGSVFTIISAALGCIDRSKWVEAKGEFMNRSGYYADVKKFEAEFPIDGLSLGSQPIHTVELELKRKNAVIIYSDEQDRTNSIIVNAYLKFDRQLELSRTQDGVVCIKENDEPSRDDALSKLLFFLFTDNAAEKQIRIYVPESLKDSLTVNGEHIVAKPNQEKLF